MENHEYQDQELVSFGADNVVRQQEIKSKWKQLIDNHIYNEQLLWGNVD